MGFDLRAASAEGLGSTFEVCFEPEDAPELRHVGVDVAAGPSAEARSVVASEAPPAAAMATVLVVDDDADARWLLEQQLEELGYRVVVADSGARALQLAHAVKPDLITLDLHMPEASGWDFLRTLRDDDDLRDVPVVICSVVAGRVVGHPCGTVAVLPKPVDRERLGDTLHGALDPGRSRVLVVDDDRDVLDIATDALRQRGLHVRTATTGARALEQLRHDPLPDALVLDLGLPDLSGSEVLGRIRSDPRTEALPVVVFTALGHDEVDPSVHDRALDVVPKHGLDFTAVARAVTDVLGNRSGP
jgi:CheY-like chemotaxis protein